MKSKGLTLLITGEGKGKTTAAMGQALRAVGHGQNVYVVFFMKGRDYGEYKAFQQLRGIKAVKAGRDSFVNKENPDPVDVKMAGEGFNKAKEAVMSGHYQMVILDEINVAVDFGLINLQDVLELIYKKPPEVHLILTGRYAPQELINAADTVSEIREVKHHYSSGVEAQLGIEY